MPLLDLDRITAGLSMTWTGFLRDGDRSLQSGNYPETTRYSYLLAAAQLARYLGEHAPDPEPEDAAADPTAVSRAHVEAFQAWMIHTRSASTALNKHKRLQQFFEWLMLDEQEISRSMMQQVRQPKTPATLIPIIRGDDPAKVLGTCTGKSFIALRDQARDCCICGDKIRQAGLMRRRPAGVPPPRFSFASFRFRPDVISVAVHWYLRYSPRRPEVTPARSNHGATQAGSVADRKLV